ncbi:MAG: hypothetical protein HY645_04505 [Acidobacteria bacterium]|nr:hypothetical protein [Acidobacteriota bacterium]
MRSRPRGSEIYREALKQAREERRELLRKVQALDQLIGSVERYLGEVPAAQNATPVPFQASSSAQPLYEGMSANAAAVLVLERENKWLHMDTIIERLLKGGLATDRDRLRRSLYTTLVRNPRVIRHPYRPATFGLTGWEAKSEL